MKTLHPILNAYNDKLQQIFFYITGACNLKCPYCYIGKKRGEHISEAHYTSVIKMATRLGCRKITLLGGEPTVHPRLDHLVKVSRQLGIHYIRVDSHGLFPHIHYEKEWLHNIDCLSVSMDGVSEETFEQMRGTARLADLKVNIGKAISLGVDVRLTFTISPHNHHEIEGIINYALQEGIKYLNFHLATGEGMARVNQMKLISPKDWIKRKQEIINYIESIPNSCKLKVNLPERYSIRHSKNNMNSKFCRVLNRSALNIGWKGQIWTCPLFIEDTNSYIGTLLENGSFKPNVQFYEEHEKRFSGLLQDCPLLPITSSFQTLCVSEKTTHVC